jgi:hypothetical protein
MSRLRAKLIANGTIKPAKNSGIAARRHELHQK